MAIEILVLITQMSFWVVFAIFIAITFLFVVERNSIHESRRSVAAMCYLLTFIAGANYFIMKDVTLGATLDNTQFPTTVRYTDWILTTPIMLALFPVVLRSSKGSLTFLIWLVIFDVIMIIAGYVAESTLNRTGEPTMLVWGGFATGGACFVMIAAILIFGLDPLARNAPPQIKRALKLMRIYVIIGWSIYPLGFAAALIAPSTATLMTRELIYNIADVVNKGGFCFIVFWSVRNLPASLSYEMHLLPKRLKRRAAY